MLRAVHQTGKLTHIGNLINLSWKDTRKHLTFLESEGFVKNVNGEYEVTEKGLEAMQAFERITDTLSPKLKALNPKIS